MKRRRAEISQKSIRKPTPLNVEFLVQLTLLLIRTYKLYTSKVRGMMQNRGFYLNTLGASFNTKAYVYYELYFPMLQTMDLPHNGNSEKLPKS